MSPQHDDDSFGTLRLLILISKGSVSINFEVEFVEVPQSAILDLQLRGLDLLDPVPGLLNLLLQVSAC